jgi:signal transduction histidine kinase
MRSFDTEIKRQISELHALRLREARQREALRGGLLKRIVSAQEAERQRIARELHDDTGQALTAIGLGLRGISSHLKSNKEKAAANLRKIEALSANALNELQRIISNLRPAHLDDLGLPAALRWYLNDTKNHTDLDINFHVEGEEKDLSDSVKIAVYRIIQEATTNTIKHAQASDLKITLCYEDEKIELWIDDNGKGMDLTQIEQNKRQSWGLLGMRERSELLNGTFKIDSEPGKGVLLNFSIPYLQPEQEFYEADEVTDEDPVING